MIPGILSLIPPQWIAGAVVLIGGLLAVLGFGAAKKRQGRAEAQAKAETRDLRGNIQTRDKIDDAEIHGDDPAAARRWLRERDAGQP